METFWSYPVISDGVSFRQNLPWNYRFRHRNYRSFFLNTTVGTSYLLSSACQAGYIQLLVYWSNLYNKVPKLTKQIISCHNFIFQGMSILLSHIWLTLPQTPVYPKLMENCLFFNNLLHTMAVSKGTCKTEKISHLSGSG